MPIRLPFFSWLRPSWGEGYGSDCSGFNGTTTASNMYHYHPGMTGGTDSSTLRSAIAQLCRMRINHKMITGSLYMICNIWSYALTISGLDGGLLEGSFIYHSHLQIFVYPLLVRVDNVHKGPHLCAPCLNSFPLLR